MRIIPQNDYTHGSDPRLSPYPQTRVGVPVMFQRWTHLTFLHWQYRPKDIQDMLPSWLTVDTFNGAAYIGLVPFVIEDLYPPLTRFPQKLSTFPETNLRTYVIDKNGNRGVYFFSLEAASLPAVLSARIGYGLPYKWSDMKISVKPELNRVTYQSSRRWPGPKNAGTSIDIEYGDIYREEDLSNLDHFLTARFLLFTSVCGVRCVARVDHDPWPLRQAKILNWWQNLVEVAGLSGPLGRPLVLYSQEIDVKVGWIKPVVLAK